MSDLSNDSIVSNSVNLLSSIYSGYLFEITLFIISFCSFNDALIPLGFDMIKLPYDKDKPFLSYIGFSIFLSGFIYAVTSGVDAIKSLLGYSVLKMSSAVSICYNIDFKVLIGILIVVMVLYSPYVLGWFAQRKS